MKSQDLIQRKESLQNDRITVLKQIKALTEDLEWQDLQHFIATGDSSQVDGAKVQKLQRRHQHILNLEGGLDKEISKLRKNERESAYQKLMRQAENLEAKRTGSLFQRIKHFLEKVQDLRAESRRMEAEVLELTNNANLYRREIIGGLNFRLPKVDEFLRENFVANSADLVKLVEEAYRINAKTLERDAEVIYSHQPVVLTLGNHKIAIVGDDMVRGFGISLNRDTGQITEIKTITCTVNQAMNNPIIMKEVKK